MNIRLFFIFIILIFLLSACTMPGPQVNNGELSGVVAATQTAMFAQPVNPTPLTLPTTAAPAIDPNSPLAGTPSAAAPTEEVPAVEPTAAPPTAIPPTNTAQPSATPAPTQQANCTNKAKLETETVPDGASFSAGQVFVKSWTLRNTGTCTWGPGYALVPFEGPAMSQASAISVTQSVPPEGTITLSVDLTAPQTAGEYQSYWKLRAPNGSTFGVGSEGQKAFWVLIEVTGSTTTNNDLGDPDWVDSFDSSKNTRWYLGEDDNLDFAIKDGKLVMTALDTGIGDRWRMAYVSEMADYRVEATVTTGAECSGKDSYGLLVRAPDQDDDIIDSGYVITFSCDGQFRYYLMEGGDYVGLENWRGNPSFRAGPNQTNTIAVSMRGNTFQIYSNGALIAEFQDNTYSKGRFGLTIRADETSEFTASVDKIAYWKLP